MSRVVIINASVRHTDRSYKYASNVVRKTTYNVATLLPKSLFEQFRRVANLYFPLVAMLSLTPFTPFFPLRLIVPLVFVVGVNLVKEGVEDWCRLLKERVVNSRTVKVLTRNGTSFANKHWKVLRVGDVIKVNKKLLFPY